LYACNRVSPVSSISPCFDLGRFFFADMAESVAAQV
jgi:hypothetical protein